MTIASKRLLLSAALGSMDDATFERTLALVGIDVPPTIDDDMSLVDYVRKVIAPAQHLKPITVDEYLIPAVHSFHEFLLRLPRIRDLTVTRMIEFRKWLELDLSKKTTGYRVSGLRYVWRSACQANIVSWFDGSDRKLSDLVPFAVSRPRQVNQLNGLLHTMRGVLKRDAIAIDLTPAVIWKAFDRMPGSKGKRQVQLKRETMKRITVSLAKVAGIELEFPPDEQKEPEFVWQATYQSEPMPDDGTKPILQKTLDSVLDELVVEREMNKKTVWQYRHAVRTFGEFYGHQALVKDLTHHNINRWLQSLQQTKTGITCRNNRIGLTVLWNYLSETHGIDSYNIRRLRRPKIIYQPVFAWTRDETSILLRAADQIKGKLNCGIPASKMLRAWIHVGYGTGLRPVDISSLQFSDIDRATGIVSIVQHKTGNPHRGQIRQEGLAAIAEIESPERRLVFPSRNITRHVKKMFKIAETMGFKRRHGQGLATLRKTHATEVCRVSGSVAASESLGHAGSTQTAKKHYIDHRAVDQGRLPPSLEGGAA